MIMSVSARHADEHSRRNADMTELDEQTGPEGAMAHLLSETGCAPN
jgi:hypothetical protein